MPFRQDVSPNAASPTVRATSLVQKRKIRHVDSPQRLFDFSGRFNKNVVGVNRAPLLQMAWFHNIIGMSWWNVVLLGALIYVTINVCFASVYLLLSMLCGAESDFVSALYFNTVTLAANGGYLGEDPKMTTPGTKCFTYRAYLVLLESYLNIAIVGLIAAVLVSKASSSRETRHYIVFSNYCCVSTFDYDRIFAFLRRPWEQPPSDNESDPVDLGSIHSQSPKIKLTAARSHIALRIGSIHSHPIIGGHLRLFVVSHARMSEALSLVANTAGRSDRSFSTFSSAYFGPGSLHSSAARGEVLTHTRPVTFHCLEEDHGNGSQELLLWTPCTIIIPLSENPLLAHAVCDAGDDAASDQARPQVQLIAVFQGSDSITGNIIEATHCYTLNEMLRHYHFGFSMLDCFVEGDDDANDRLLSGGAKGSKQHPGADDDALRINFRHFNEIHSDI